jgi:hypothetical protein
MKTIVQRTEGPASGTLRIVVEGNGDISVLVRDVVDIDEPDELAAFRCVGFSVSRSPRTHAALLALAEAMEADAWEDSSREPPAREAPSEPLRAAAAWWWERAWTSLTGTDEQDAWQREFEQLARERLARTDPLHVSALPAYEKGQGIRFPGRRIPDTNLPDDFLREVRRRLELNGQTCAPDGWPHAAMRIWRSGLVKICEADGEWRTLCEVQP